MYAPAMHDESRSLVNYVDQQLAAIQASVFGLTEEQARATPCRSALSIAGILKHTAYGMRGAVARMRSDEPGQNLSPEAFAAYMGSFTLNDHETGASVLVEFQAARREFLEVLRRVDPDEPSTAPPSPWFGIFDARPIRARYYLLHQIEEMARHAGHADIIREQLDGMAVPALQMTLEGVPGNDFFEPYVAAPGTLGS